VPHCWPAGHASFVWHGRATRHRVPVLDPWRFRATLSDLFHGFKFASLALISAKYHPSFHSFSNVLENTGRCNMSEMHVNKADLTLFLTRLSLKTWEKRCQILAKVGSK